MLGVKRKQGGQKALFESDELKMVWQTMFLEEAIDIVFSTPLVSLVSNSIRRNLDDKSQPTFIATWKTRS